MESLLLQYPEFSCAGLLAFVIAASAWRQQGDAHLPLWLAEPAKACLSVSSQGYLGWLSKMLMQANRRNNFSYGDYACFKVYGPLLTLLLLFVVPPYAVLALTVVAFVAPDAVLALKVAQRQKEIYRALPQALDLMVLCVDAGLGLDATLQKISSEGSGIGQALNEELNILGHEIFLGVDREHAYAELYNRTGVDQLKTLGSALNQANKLGLSLSRILRGQSDFIRKKQSQNAEERAMKLPIYMSFPLWFFIMPALMLLVLGPSLIKFYQEMHGPGL
ncbi:MAG TPA: type II secretion system F family protein [Planktothrix sp.]|jgi:tight adherence protein C